MGRYLGARLESLQEINNFLVYKAFGIIRLMISDYLENIKDREFKLVA